MDTAVQTSDDEMTQYVGVAKAARLLGISRRQIQQYIHDGELETFEGRLDVEALRRRYPELCLDEDTLVERVRHIKSSAFSRRVSDTVTPDQATLTDQLKRTKTELAVAKGRADHIQEVLDELTGRMRDLARDMDPEPREHVYDLLSWLSCKLHD